MKEGERERGRERERERERGGRGKREREESGGDVWRWLLRWPQCRHVGLMRHNAFKVPYPLPSGGKRVSPVKIS